jgi:adenine-specific DNA-methyltransferase
LEKSNFPRVDFAPDPGKTEAENVEALRAYIREKEDTFLRTWDRHRILDEVLLKSGFMLDYTLAPAPRFTNNTVELVNDGHRTALVCLDESIAAETVDAFRGDKDATFICLEAALDTTKKWNLKHHLGDRLRAI